MLLLVAICATSLNVFAQRVGYEWIEIVDTSTFVYIAIDNENNIVLASKGHIQKFDTYGNLLWLTQDTLMGIRGITVDNNKNIYVSGRYVDIISQTQTSYTANTFVFLEKYDSSGNRIWMSTSAMKTITYPDNLNSSESVACDSNGGVYITGSYSESIAFDSISLVDNNLSAIYVTKYDSSGNVQWVKNMNGANSNDALSYGQGNDIAVDYSNNIYLTGTYRGPFVFGNTTFQCQNSSDIFLTKLDVNGDFLYTNTYGGIETDEGCRIAINKNNDIALLAKFGDVISIDGNNYQAVNNYNNPIIIRFKDDSIFVVTHIGEASNGGEILSDICFDNNQSIIYGGWVDFGLIKPMLYKIDSTGTIIWNYMVTECISSTNANVYSIASDSLGVYIAGSANNNVYFGDTLLGTAVNQGHTYLGKIDTTKVYSGFNPSINKNSLFRVFPNPTDGKLSIISSSKSLTNGILNLYNVEGELINRFDLNSYNTTISLQNLGSGVYFLEIINDNNYERIKVIKY